MKLNLKALRERHGLTQNELAIQMNMSVENLRRLENNRLQGASKTMMINFDHVDLFCEVLLCRIDELITVERVKL